MCCAVFALLANVNVKAQTSSFFTLNQITVGSEPGALAIADTDGDRKPDLVVVNQGSSSLTLERGGGYGYFQHWADQSAGASPRAIAVGDFNGDGKLDLAVANFASTTSLYCWALATEHSNLSEA
jgi:hypothetical protein